MGAASLTYKESLRNAAKKVLCALGAAAAVFVFCLPMFSQAAVGTILGGVFDSSGGAITGAKVTITDVARGTTRQLTTDASGQFTAPSLLSGTYTVRAEATGFQAFEQQNVVLEVAQDVRVDLRLTPGAQTQLEEQCRAAGIQADAFQFTGDYYALPNLVPLLARPSKLDLLMEILEHPLPARKPA